MQPQYAPQYPQYPAQPAPQGYPVQPQYAPPAPPMQYPPQQYAPQPQYAPPMPAPVAGSLDEFFSQPGGGSGASWKFKDKPIGTVYHGIVARAVTKGDVRQQTDNNNRPLTFKDGRPKFVMVVPMLVQPSAEYPEGTAAWWVKGQARDELVRAMAEAGAPDGPPEAGAAISVTLVGKRPIPGMNDAFQYRVQYVRPAGAPPAAHLNGSLPPAVPVAPVQQYGPTDAEAGYTPGQYAQPAPAPAQPAYVPQLQYAPQPAPQAYGPQPTQPAYVPGMDGSMVPALNIGATVTPPVAPPAPVPPAQLSGLNPEQQALMAQLSGQPQPTH